MSKKGMGMGMGKGKGGEDEDTSTYDLYVFYQRFCIKNGIAPMKGVKRKYDEMEEEGEEFLTMLHLWEEAGPMNIRALCDAMKEVKYKHIKSLRLWRTKAQDEGVRACCEYLKLATTELKILDLLDNQITPLGCEFLGQTLAGGTLTILKLDHNPFGSEGLANLALGLSKNSVLNHLSLSYCNIDENGAKSLQQILAFVKTDLKELNLQGNQLKNKGTFELFRALEINGSLESINLADNQFGETGEGEKLIEKIQQVFKENKILREYDFNFNGIYDEGALKLKEVLKESKVFGLVLPDRINRDLIKEIEAILKKNRPRGRKKKKKKS